MIRPCCIARILDDGTYEYLFSGEVDFYVIDEQCPHDRVYQLTDEAPRDALDRLVGPEPIGHKDDARHVALQHRISAFLSGKSHLRSVPPVES